MRRRNPPTAAVADALDEMLRQVFPTAQITRANYSGGSAQWDTDIHAPIAHGQGKTTWLPVTFVWATDEIDVYDEVTDADRYESGWRFNANTEADAVYDACLEFPFHQPTDEIVRQVETALITLRDAPNYPLRVPGTVPSGPQRWIWRKNPRGRTRAMTYTNISALRAAVRASPDSIIRRVARTAVPHLHRAIEFGWLEEVPGERDAWQLTDAGRRGIGGGGP